MKAMTLPNYAQSVGETLWRLVCMDLAFCDKAGRPHREHAVNAHTQAYLWRGKLKSLCSSPSRGRAVEKRRFHFVWRDAINKYLIINAQPAGMMARRYRTDQIAFSLCCEWRQNKLLWSEWKRHINTPAVRACDISFILSAAARIQKRRTKESSVRVLGVRPAPHWPSHCLGKAACDLLGLFAANLLCCW